MCDRWDTRIVRVKIAADLSHTGQARWKDVAIDSCIADVVEALQTAGIDMVSSCCGHGLFWGCIGLEDGRHLLIAKERNAIVNQLAGLYSP